MRTHLSIIGAGLLWLASCGTGYSQIDSLGGLTGKLMRYEQAALPEKLFLHLDRPLYLSGETMWFKVYAVEGTYSRPLPLSTVAYVEVLNHQQRAVLRAAVPLAQATGHGSFGLPATLASGTYTVRAYTAWMQNFGPEFFFHQPVTVVNTSAAVAGTGQDSVKATYAVRFFPEGGNLVQGLSSKVAFQITDRAGRGTAASGQVLDQTGAVAATFGTSRLGMGSFLFAPMAGRTYTAVVKLKNGLTVRQRLPAAYEQGIVMRLEEADAGSLTVSVSSTNTTQSETVFLLGHSRQQVTVAARAQLIDGHATFRLDKSKLLDGISHFTLFDADQKPRCERLYFQPPRHPLGLTARPDKPQYTPRDKVSVAVATAAAPAASLSVAVYRLDSLVSTSAADISSYLWLTSELKGPVENPGYYFNDPTAADNLMLTQGWSRFRWENVLTAAPPRFPHLPELHGPLVQARLTQVGTGKPLRGIQTYFSTPSRIIQLSTALSDAQGMVRFETANFYGPHEIVLQTNPQQDSTCQIEVLSPFAQQFAPAPAGSFAPLARFRPDYAKRHFQAQVQTLYANQSQSRYLLPPPPDSTAFYGKPDETYLLDKYTRFRVLEEVMREYVPGVVVRLRKDGFHFLVIDKLNKTLFTDPPLVLLDGVPVFNLNKMMAMDPLKIQKLEVIDRHYFLGPLVYSGVVSYTTYKGDLEGFPLDSHALMQQYEGLQGQREFYAPRYDTPQQKQSRLPDLRNLLYWNPNITTTGPAAQQLEFFTGDQTGRYLVVLQGLSADGQAGSTSTTFEVKPNL